MRHDPNDLRPQIRFRIFPKKRTQEHDLIAAICRGWYKQIYRKRKSIALPPTQRVSCDVLG